MIFYQTKRFDTYAEANLFKTQKGWEGYTCFWVDSKTIGYFFGE